MWGYKAMFGYRRTGQPDVPPELGTLEEQVGVSVGVEDVEWIEIITVSSAQEEEVGVSVGLEGITWEEVE